MIKLDYFGKPYETSEEMEELREIKMQISKEMLARTREEQEKHMKELMDRIRPMLTTATFQ